MLSINRLEITLIQEMTSGILQHPAITCKTTNRAGIHGNSGENTLESNQIGIEMTTNCYK